MVSRLVFLLTALAGALSAQTCTFTVSAAPQSFPIAGGSGVVKIVASASTCARTVASAVDWIVIDYGQQGTGDGSAGFTVAANSTSPGRTGAITVGPQSITITQAGPPCNFAINPSSANSPSAGGGDSFSLTGLAGCSWTASANASWLQITSSTSGMGPATIAYSAQANPGSARSGTISIGSLTFTVNQAGVCAYTLNPTSGTYSASGGNGTFAVNSSSGCAWTAVASDSWIHITSGQSGSGPGQVSFATDPNTGSARNGSIAVAGQTFTIAQSSPTCSFTLSPASLSIPSSGGNATFSVSAPTGCMWTAATTAPWITIVSGGSGSGAGVVAVSVSPNTGDGRMGTVTVGGQILPVTQAGTGGIQISPDSIANAASYAQGGVSPGLIVTVSVPGVGPPVTVTEQLTPDDNFFTTQLGGVRILFDGVAAPMVYAANGQFSAIVPYEVAGQDSTQMQVEYQGTLSNSVSLPVVQSQPGLFSLDASGHGPGAILDPQFQLNSASNPAPIGSAVLLFATGEGQTAPPGVDGKLGMVPLPSPQLPVSVTIDGINAPVLYSGAAPGLVAGLIQINVQIPDGVAPGAQPVVVQIGQAQSQAGVTVAIQ